MMVWVIFRMFLSFVSSMVKCLMLRASGSRRMLWWVSKYSSRMGSRRAIVHGVFSGSAGVKRVSSSVRLS